MLIGLNILTAAPVPGICARTALPAWETVPTFIKRSGEGSITRGSSSAWSARTSSSMNEGTMNAQEFWESNPDGRVTAKRRIYQSPLSGAPPVPQSTRGWIEDVADDLLWVDFGGLYGVVCCERREVNPGGRGSLTAGGAGVMILRGRKTAPATRIQ